MSFDTCNSSCVCMFHNAAILVCNFKIGGMLHWPKLVVVYGPARL